MIQDGVHLLRARSSKALATAVLLASAAATEAAAAPGDLDPSFGSGGKATTQIGARPSKGQAMAVQGNGKIVVAGFAGVDEGSGDFAVAKVRSSLPSAR